MDLFERLREGRFTFEWNQQEIEKLRHEMRESNRSTIQAIIGATLLIGGFIAIGVNNGALNQDGFSILALILGFAGAVCLYLAYSR
jgi:hypothetical protein